MTTYFGFAIADGMFSPECFVNRVPISVNEVRATIKDGGVVPILNPFHTETIAAMNARFDLHIEIPAEPPRVTLATGDRVVVMSVRGLPRLTESREYTAEEIASATFTFGLWTVEPKKTTVQDIVALAAHLPSGLNDAKAADKLVVEHGELLEALENDDRVGALTEAADAAYYAAKHLDYVARLLDISIDDVLNVARAKYELRAQPGNPKNDEKERLAVQAAT